MRQLQLPFMASLRAGVLALICLQFAGAARIQPASLTHNLHEKAHHEPHSQNSLEPQVQQTPASQHESHPHGQLVEESLLEETVNTTGNASPSLLQSGRSTSNMSAHGFAHLMAANLGITIPGSNAEPSMRIRIIMLMVLLGVFVCTGCVCYLGTSKMEDAKNANGRNQYVCKNRIIYEWDQTPKSMTIYTKPPGGITKSNIEVLVWPRHVHIGRKGKPSFLKEELFAAVSPESSSWCIADGELEIRLHKSEAGEWPCVMLAHMDKKTSGKQTRTNGSGVEYS